MNARFLKMVLLATLVTASGCGGQQTQSQGTTAVAFEKQVSDRLYFGRNIPGGGVVSDTDWQTFLSEVVTPRFPAGLSVWRAQGQWRDADSTIQHEDSFILDLLHADDEKSEQSVREIMTAYKTRFKQEAVLRVKANVCTSL